MTHGWECSKRRPQVHCKRLLLAAERRTRMRLTIVGDLTLSSEQLQRIHGLGLSVSLRPIGSSPDAVRADLRESAFAFFNNVDVNGLLSACDRLRLGVLAYTGYHGVDRARAQQLGVQLAYLADYSTSTVVEYVLSGILAALRSSSRELAGTAVGCVGYGRIGKGVGRAVTALGADLAVTTRTQRQCPDAQWSSVTELVRDSQVLVRSSPCSQRL